MPVYYYLRFKTDLCKEGFVQVPTFVRASVQVSHEYRLIFHALWIQIMLRQVVYLGLNFIICEYNVLFHSIRKINNFIVYTHKVCLNSSKYRHEFKLIHEIKLSSSHRHIHA